MMNELLASSSRISQHYLYNLKNDDENGMTWSRRAARYLSQFRWYYPAQYAEHGPSLDAAWAHYENVTLPRCYNHDVTAATKNNHDYHNNIQPTKFAQASQSARNVTSTCMYPVWETPLKELVQFGVSIRMYFSTLLVASAIMGFCGLFSIPLMVFFWGNANGMEGKAGVDYMGVTTIRGSAICDATEWVECETCHASQNIQDYPAYRLDTNGDNDDGRFWVLRNAWDFEHWLRPGLCSFAATVFLLLFQAVASWKQRRAEIVFDEDIQTASDYSIKIFNPPPDAIYAEEWKKFFDRFASDKDKGVVLVTIALNNAKLLHALIRRRKKLRALSLILPPGTDMTDSTTVYDLVLATPKSTFWSRYLLLMQDATQLWSEIQRLEEEIRGLVQEKYHAVAVFVTFETERSQRNALHALSTGKLHIWNNQLDRSRLGKGGILKVWESIRNSTLWDCQEVAREERTIQLNLTRSSSNSSSDSKFSCSRTLLFRAYHVLQVKETAEPNDVRWIDLQASCRQRLELYLASTLGMLLFVMWSGYFIYSLVENYPGYYATLFIALTNTVVPVVCEKINDIEAHPTEHGKQISLYVKITIFRWFNSAIALSVISSFIETISVENGNEHMHQSLIYKVYPVIVAELFVSPVVELMDVEENFRKHILAPRARDQEEMNACFSGGSFWLAERYTNANKVLFVALFFSSILPEAHFLGSMALLAQYYVGKFSLLRLCGPTPDIGFHLSRLSRNCFIPFILIMHVVMSAYWWSGYPYDNVCEVASGGYTYCNQNFYSAGIFPPLPRFQPRDTKWMSESQETLTSLYGWTSVVAILIAFLAFLRNIAVPRVRAIYESIDEPDGRDQGIDFSQVKNHKEVHGFIPQVRVPGFVFPMIACDIGDVEEELIDWKDKVRGYSHHSLVDDVHIITKSEILYPVFSIVQQWTPT